MTIKSIAQRALDQGKGILRLVPTWVPRSFCIPGRRLKLHPSDYFSLGLKRGGIDERWLSSTTKADNGPLTAPNEGLSYVVVIDGNKEQRISLKEAISELGADIIGEHLWKEYGSWPVYSKFFDNKGPLPFHIHHRKEHAHLIGMEPKPEAYYFPPQLNNYGADFPYTFFGLQPGTTKAQLKERLEAFSKGDNRITDLSVAYTLQPGTGWDVPAGILHAPGSLCTYEPQWASDIFAMYESIAGEAVVDEPLLWKGSPPDKQGDYDYLVEVVDWEANVDPDFVANHFMQPKPVKLLEEMEAQGYQEMHVCYRSAFYSATELTIFPEQMVTIRDEAAYGLIVVQGHGKMNDWDIETPALIRFGQLTHDEFFITEEAAKSGVTFDNPSSTDPIVVLKLFGPEEITD